MGGQSHTCWLRAAEIAGTQWGNVTFAQLRSCGCSERQIDGAVLSGRIFRQHKAVYALGRKPAHPLERASAAVLSCGKGGLAADDWAFWMWGFARHPPQGKVHVVTRNLSGRTDIVPHRTRHLEPDVNNGIPLTAPVRTIIDCAPHLSQTQIRRAVNDGLIRGLFRPEAVLGTKLEKLVAADQHGATRSKLEDILADIARENRWGPPAHNPIIHGVEVDFAYPRWRIIIEADGYAFHYTKIAFENDHARRLYLEARGQRVIAVTYAQVTTHRARTVRELTAVLQDVAVRA